MSLRFVGNAGGSLQFGLDKEEEEDGECVGTELEKSTDTSNSDDREHMV